MSQTIVYIFTYMLDYKTRFSRPSASGDTSCSPFFPSYYRNFLKHVTAHDTVLLHAAWPTSSLVLGIISVFVFFLRLSAYVCSGFVLPLVHSDHRAHTTFESGAQYGCVRPTQQSLFFTVRSRLRIFAACGYCLPWCTIHTPPHTLIMALSPVVHVRSSSAGAAARAAPCAP